MKRIFGSLILSVLLLVGSASLLFAQESDTYPLDRIAAVVGEDIILYSEVIEKAAPALQELDKAVQGGGADLMAGGRRGQIIKETLEQTIDDTLVGIEAREMKLQVTSEELDRAIANMARENGIDVPTLKEAIQAQGMDFFSYRHKLRSQLLRFKVLNLRVRGRVKISEAEARQYYNNQVRDVRATGSFEGAHILIALPKDARAADAALARKKAEEILTRLKNGEDFATLAREYSDDKATSRYGGSLGLRTPGEIPAVMDRAFLDLEVGELAGPLRTPAGYHILRLNDRQALGVQPFAEVKDRIIAQLAQEEMMRQEKIWLKELRLKTFIDVRM